MDRNYVTVSHSMYTAISYDVIHDVFVLYICLSESRRDSVWYFGFSER